MNPRYPVYIPTKGRWKTPYTIRALERIGVPYKAVIEPQEVDDYASVIGEENIIILPYHNKGLVVTRNWIWDHVADLGAPRFWTMDDNIREFYYLTRNIKHRVSSGTFLYIMEDFIERYENVPIAGMNYEMFVPRKRACPPFLLNTRIYSNMLIQTEAKSPSGKPYRNEGYYNDDTDLCLRIPKDGWCTILFNVFLADKLPTMSIKGGMTPHYQGDGRLKMAQSLQRQHPDVVKIVHKWGRWQHQVDYRPFKANRLIRKQGVIIPEGVNNYGMVLMKRGKPA